jgi:capsid protein
MFGWLRGKSSAPKQMSAAAIRTEAFRMAKQMVSARFDAAQHGEEDRRYWSLVDSLSADAAMSPEVRRLVRNRARYEAGNGGYCNGMVKQKGNDLIGTGPRLQMLTQDETVNSMLEAAWNRWSRLTRLARTLRTACRCKIRDGAALGLLAHNPTLPTAAKVHLRLVDVDRLHSPDLMSLQPNRVDGIDFDAYGNPERYWILDVHPGAMQMNATQKATAYPAAAVIHWYDEDRAEQHHGLSELAPSLRRFGQHRRFITATVRAGEVAAEIAAFFTTPNLPEEDEVNDDGTAVTRKSLDVVDMEFGGIMFAPEGNDVKTVKSEHPNTVFGDFNDRMVTEESRPLLMSSNVANGNFNKASYASSRAETQISDQNDAIDRDDVEIVILEPLFEQWLRETLSESSGIGPSDIDLSLYAHEWQWDHKGHVDPTKDSSADDMDLKNGSLSLPTKYARSGQDWRSEFKKQAEALGKTFAEIQELNCRAIYEPTKKTVTEQTGANTDAQNEQTATANAD